VLKLMKKTCGFTLIEMLIVVAIIITLAAIILPNITGSNVNARIATTRTNVSTLRSAIQLYLANNSAFPTALTDADSGGETTELVNATYLLNGNTVPYLSGPFPTELMSSAAGSSAEVAVADGGGGWAYTPANGQVAVNVNTAGLDANVTWPANAQNPDQW